LGSGGGGGGGGGGGDEEGDGCLSVVPIGDGGGGTATAAAAAAAAANDAAADGALVSVVDLTLAAGEKQRAANVHDLCVLPAGRRTTAAADTPTRLDEWPMQLAHTHAPVRAG